MFKEEDHPRDKGGKFAEKGGSSGEKLAEAIKQYSDDPARDLAAAGLPSGEKPKGKSAKERENNLKPRGQTDLPQGVSKAEYIQSELGVSPQRAQEYADALDAYSDNKYSEIRAFQQGEHVKDAERIRKISDDLEDYIKKAPRWNGGETFRGVGLTDEQLAAYTIGSEHDMLGVSSWSNDISVAKDFAGNDFGKRRAVIFHSKTQHKGTAIRHLVEEEHHDENEVLVSKESKYRVKKIERVAPKNVFDIARTHIYLEEV